MKINPARLVRQKHEENGVIRWLTGEEEKAIRKAIEENCPEHLPEFVISLGTGMRLDNQFKLTWGCVDLVRKEVRVPRTKNYAGNTIPMNAVVEAAFVELKARAGAVKRGDLVFSRFPRNWWEDVIAKSGVVNYRWHDNRHTFCSRLAMKGVNLKVIQVLAGHKTIAITARYAHLDDTSLRTAVNLL